MTNQQMILTYLSSSELNRCKKNGYDLFKPVDGWRVIGLPWMTKKLRRKIGHLWQLGVLPELPRKPLIGMYTGCQEPFPGFGDMLAKQYLAIEDHFILTGEIKSQV
jgi:hypothetical protein